MRRVKTSNHSVGFLSPTPPLETVVTGSKLELFTILVPVEFDEDSRAAVKLACEYARGAASRIVLLHVVPPANSTEESNTERERAHRMLREHFADALSGAKSVEIRCEVRSGDPMPTILRAADEHRAGLVVVGMYGQTSVSRVLLGSFAERLIRSQATRSSSSGRHPPQPDGRAELSAADRR
jgi:nucleotide-binding universal stress UspA family protein